MSSKSRRWKSMLHKVEHLRLEVEDCSEKLKEWERQLESDVMKEVGHGSPQPETGNIPSEESMSALANGAHQQKDMPEGSVEGTQEVEAPPSEEQSHKLSNRLRLSGRRSCRRPTLTRQAMIQR